MDSERARREAKWNCTRFANFGVVFCLSSQANATPKIAAKHWASFRPSGRGGGHFCQETQSQFVVVVVVVVVDVVVVAGQPLVGIRQQQ